jgi:hypothetical protein
MSVHTRIYWLDMPHSERLPALSAARWAALLRDKRAAALPTAFALESLANAHPGLCLAELGLRGGLGRHGGGRLGSRHLRRARRLRGGGDGHGRSGRAGRGGPSGSASAAAARGRGAAQRCTE